MSPTFLLILLHTGLPGHLFIKDRSCSSSTREALPSA